MQDNLSTHITRVYVDNRKAKESGNPYSILVVEFHLPNGEVYPFETFLSNEQRSLINFSTSITGSQL